MERQFGKRQGVAGRRVLPGFEAPGHLRPARRDMAPGARDLCQSSVGLVFSQRALNARPVTPRCHRPSKQVTRHDVLRRRVVGGPLGGYAVRRMAVLVAPGLRLFTRTREVFSSSLASTCIKPSVANLDTA